jgi:hypothetical protein
MKNDEMGGARFPYRENSILPENLKGRDYLGEKGVYGTVTEMGTRRYFLEYGATG